jgi:hypothetical protein
MALSPAEVKAKRELRFQDQLQDLEKKIDEMLMRGAFNFSVQGLERGLIEAIKECYEYVGWKVTFISDQRDGSYLSFSEKK